MIGHKERWTPELRERQRQIACERMGVSIRYHTCAHCGATFRHRTRGGNKDTNTYCSKQCAYSAGDSHKPCTTCGKERNPAAIKHGLPTCYACRCAERAQIEKPDRKCQCGASLMKHRQLCDVCRDGRAKQRNKHSDKCKNHRQRARKYGVEYQYVSTRMVVQAVGTTCGICGDAIDTELRHPHPMSLSVDHIVPLSRGGGHLLSNLQPSHLICNVKKGAAVA